MHLFGRLVRWKQFFKTKVGSLLFIDSWDSHGIFSSQEIGCFENYKLNTPGPGFSDQIVGLKKQKKCPNFKKFKTSRGWAVPSLDKFSLIVLQLYLMDKFGPN